MKPAIRESKPMKYQELTEEQIALVKSTIIKGASEATDDELKLFIMVCERSGLDPFREQIRAIKRWDSSQKKDVMTIQTGIMGFRLIAQRSKARGGPEYKGQTHPLWYDEKGNWHDLWLQDKPPFAAKVGVHVEGFAEPMWGIAEYKRLVQRRTDGTPNVFWEKGAAFQLAKCAEAAAIRKAFPEDTSAIYLEEEMGAGEEIEITPPISVEEAKKALSPPAQPVSSGLETRQAGDPGVEGARQPLGGDQSAVAKGEGVVPAEHRKQILTHLQGLGVVEGLPADLTDIEAGLLLACKTQAKANKTLDEMAVSRDQRKLV